MAIFPLAKKVDSYKTIAPCKFDAPRGDGTQVHLELYLGERGITSSAQFKTDKKPYMRKFTPSDPAAFLDSLNVK